MLTYYFQSHQQSPTPWQESQQHLHPCHIQDNLSTHINNDQASHQEASHPKAIPQYQGSVHHSSHQELTHTDHHQGPSTHHHSSEGEDSCHKEVLRHGLRSNTRNNTRMRTRKRRARRELLLLGLRLLVLLVLLLVRLPLLGPANLLLLCLSFALALLPLSENEKI